jgi:tetratricopeptide (TPR) repeat protein
MVTGRRPSDGDEKTPVADLPRSWTGPMSRALQADPTQRVQTPFELVQELEEKPESPKRSFWTRGKVASVVAAVALLLVLLRLSGVMQWNAPSPLTDTKIPVVLLGEVENLTGNQAYDVKASQFLDVAMEQSRYVNVLSRSRVSEALAHAGRSASERLTPALTLALGKQEGADYVLSGEVTRNGESTQLSLIATRVSSGKVSKQLEASLMSPEELPAVIGKAAVELRNWLGESPSQINATNVPLEPATTRSAIAWERYSRAVRLGALGQVDDEVNLLRSAVEIDPDFAAAYLDLGVEQNNLGDAEAGLASVTRAFALKDHVTEREAYTIAGLYHALRFEPESATEAFRTLTNLYPFDDAGQKYFAQTLLIQFLVSDAIKAAQHAVELNPNNMLNVGTLATAFLQGGFNDETLSLIERQNGRPGVQSTLQYKAQAWLGKHDYEKAEEAFSQMSHDGGYWQNIGYRWLPATRIAEGRLKEAASELEAGIDARPRGNDAAMFFKLHNWAAWTYSLENDREMALRHLNAVVQEPSSPVNLRDLRSAGVIMIDIGEVGSASRILAAIHDFSQKYKSNLYPGALAHLRGELARAAGDRQEAARQFEQAIKLWPDILALWSAARFYAEIGDFERARSLYNEMLSRKGEIVRWYFPGLIPLAELGRARMESKLGDDKKAAIDYDSFLSTFGRFSPDLTIVKTAQSERRRISQPAN